MLNELKQKLAIRQRKNHPALKKLAPGLRPVPYTRGGTKYNKTKEILVNARGKPYVVFIPAQVREEDKAILSNDLLRPNTLDMRFLRARDSDKAVFGDGYYNTRFFGLKPAVPSPGLPSVQPSVQPSAKQNKRCQKLLQKLARVNDRLHLHHHQTTFFDFFLHQL